MVHECFTLYGLSEQFILFNIIIITIGVCKLFVNIINYQFEKRGKMSLPFKWKKLR